MYVQKFTQEEPHSRSREKAAVTIPENYVGNAFTDEEAPEEPQRDDAAAKTEASQTKSRQEDSRTENPPPVRRAELLPLLVSLLLSENQEWEDIATLLLFLVLF